MNGRGVFALGEGYICDLGTPDVPPIILDILFRGVRAKTPFRSIFSKHLHTLTFTL